MPVLDRLLEDEDDSRVVLDMLFDFSCWHATAKLRAKTDSTLEALDVFTVASGTDI